MKKAIKIIFTVSVLLNIALIGVVGGHAFKKQKGYESHNKFENLSAETRDILEANRQKMRADKKGNWERKKQDREALQKIISADVFNRDEYNDAVGKMLDQRDDMMRSKAATMAEILDSLPQAEREELSKHIMRGLSGQKRHKKYGSCKGREEGAKGADK